MGGPSRSPGRRLSAGADDPKHRIPGVRPKGVDRRLAASAPTSPTTKRRMRAGSPGGSSTKRPASGSKPQPKKRARSGNVEQKAEGGDEIVDGIIGKLREMVGDGGADDDEDLVELMEAVKEAGAMEHGLGSDIESVQDSPSEDEGGLNGDGSEGREMDSSEEDSGSDEEMNGEELGVKRARTEEEDGREEGEGVEADMGTLGMHKKDLEGLKKSDPSFYKYLLENDAELLDLGDDDENDGLKSEAPDSASQSDASDSDDEAAEEAAALAEAGLADGSSADSGDEEENEIDGVGERRPEANGDRQKRSARFVDMAAVRAIEEQLALNRGALKAVKDLLRMFRAGRNLTTVAQENAPTKQDKNATGRAKAKIKAKARAKAKSAGRNAGSGSDVDDTDGSEDDDDLFGSSDGGFMAGDIKFASARVYQKVMYLAIVKIQETLDRLLGKPKARPGSVLAARWAPTEHARWPNLKKMFRSFCSQLFALTEGMQDPATLRFLLKRAQMFVPYTRGNLRLTRRLIKLALGVWSPETRDIGEVSKLRAYLLLRAVAGERDNVQPVLRAVYNSYYTTIAKACNPRTLPNIMFSAKCIVDLFGMDMAASYTVAFSCLREMAVTLRSVLTSKDQKADVDKIHNWSFVNALRLWSLVLSTYGSEDELRPLIYPFVQVAIGVMRVQPTPRSYPLRLHVASYLTSIVSKTGVYIPVATHLLALLRCAELRRKPIRGATKVLEWRSMLRVSDEVVKTKPFLTGLVDGIVLQLAAFYASFSRHVSFPELSHHTALVLRKFSKEAKESAWRSSAHAFSEKLKENGVLVASVRARATFGPHGAAGTRGMLEPTPGLDMESAKRTPVQRFYDVELARVKRDEALRDEALLQKSRHGDATAAGDEVRPNDGEELDSEDGSEDSVAESDMNRDSAQTRVKATHKTKKELRQPSAERQVLSMFRLQEGDDADSDEMQELLLSSDEE